MSITYKNRESVGHDRTGKDYGYVEYHVPLRQQPGPVPNLINAKRWKSCGRMRRL